MANELQGRRVAILIALVGTEQVELTEPKRPSGRRASVDGVGLRAGDARAMNSDVDPGETFTVEKSVTRRLRWGLRRPDRSGRHRGGGQPTRRRRGGGLCARVL